MLKIYNTLSRQVEEFKPISDSKVGMYACGPTVYDYTHIGHLKKYIGDDILVRVLAANGFAPHHIMNITDVGHLVSDEDAGEDKIEKGARERGETVWDLANFFTAYFFRSTDSVNIQRPDIAPKATEHIKEQIKLIQKLEKNGFIYITDHAIYFDISKFPDYTKLSGQKLTDKQTGVRDEVIVDSQKKNPSDFALWFFTVGRFENHVMHWDSPWGDGFPGWHIECSAMSMEYLGDSFDIHTGGVDHIPVHHTNEIAQSEAATGHKFVNYWVHHEHLMVDGTKMSKSLNNFYKIDDIEAKGFDLLALRYLFLMGHYRDQMNFTWDSLEAAQNALYNLRNIVRDWDEPQETAWEYYQKFLEAVNNDLNTPQALAVLQEMVKSDIPSSQKSAELLEMDKILGLKFDEYINQKIEIPQEVLDLVEKREQARESNNFKESDKLRAEIKKLGFEVGDTATGPKISKS